MMVNVIYWKKFEGYRGVGDSGMIEFNGSYQQYESYEAYLLCDEFDHIPGNRLTFRIPEGMVVTCDMIRCFLKAAYLDKGIWNVLEM